MKDSVELNSNYHDIKVRTSTTDPEERIKNKQNETSLHKAIRELNIELIQILIQNKDNLSKQNAKGQTPLQLAMTLKVKKNNDLAHQLLFLLQEKMELEAIHKLDHNGNSILHIAAQEGNLEAYRLFSPHFKDSHNKNKFDQTPLKIAIEKGYFNLVREMLEDFNTHSILYSEGEILLINAAKAKSTLVFNELIKAKIHYPLYAITLGWEERINEIKRHIPSNWLEALIACFCPAASPQEILEYDPLQSSIQYTPNLFSSILSLAFSIIFLGFLAWARYALTAKINETLISTIETQKKLQLLKAVPERLTLFHKKFKENKLDDNDLREAAILNEILHDIQRPYYDLNIGRGRDTGIADQLTTRERCIIYINMVNYALCSIDGLLSLTMIGFALLAVIKHTSAAVLFSSLFMGPIGGGVVTLIAAGSLLAIFGYVAYKIYKNRDQVHGNLTKRYEELANAKMDLKRERLFLSQSMQQMDEPLKSLNSVAPSAHCH